MLSRMEQGMKLKKIIIYLKKFLVNKNKKIFFDNYFALVIMKRFI